VESPAQTTRIDQCLSHCPLPALEARALLAHISGLSREALIAFPERTLSSADAHRFEHAVQRRVSGEPLAYIVGGKEFYGRWFQVDPRVLIPRPETEHLIEAALKKLPQTAPARILDLGTGSGCIAITLALERPQAQVLAADTSSDALCIARMNAERLGADIQCVHSDWFEHITGTYDLIAANPPYIAPSDPHLTALTHEPQLALTDGADGLNCLKTITQAAPRFLKPGGWLVVEHGYDQGPAVRALYARAALTQIQTVRDLAGQERVCMGQKAAGDTHIA